jgi:signal peptidase
LAGDVLFYAVLVLMVVSALIYSAQGRRGGLMGVSVYTVLTGSMQRALPQGSLLVVTRTDPEDIRVGDDITFYPGGDAAVTHRVVEVLEDYEGERAFRTQGTENPSPDGNPVKAPQVAGRVLFHIPWLGAALYWLREHWYLALPLAGVLLALSFLRKRTRVNS